MRNGGSQSLIANITVSAWALPACACFGVKFVSGLKYLR
jgi:hypothetical protein